MTLHCLINRIVAVRSANSFGRKGWMGFANFKGSTAAAQGYRGACCLVFALVFGVSVSGQDDPFIDVAPANGRYVYGPAEIPAQLTSVQPGANTAGYSFQWQVSTQPTTGFSNIAGATGASLSFTTPLTGHRFYRRQASLGGVIFWSKVVRYELGSAHWEDMSYERVHTVLVPAQTSRTQVDALPIGSKLVTTIYVDGLGRPLQSVSREAATPGSGSTVWGDLVKHYAYDALGRSPQNFLPYSSTANPGKYKPNAGTDVVSYYSSNFGDNSPFSQTAFENSPLNRPLVGKAPGGFWAGGTGDKVEYLVNTAADDVKRFVIGDAEGDMPALSALQPVYAAGTLLKQESKDEHNRLVVTFSDLDGKIVAKRVQFSSTISANDANWISTYYVYNDLGQLRCEINPEGVLWLINNGWSFAASGGATVFAEQCFVYLYDAKGRMYYKKSPGVQPLFMVYDLRDRMVLTQDGNQRAKVPTQEWTAYLYDELDRPTASTLFLSNAGRAALQSAKGASAQPVLTAAELADGSFCTPLSYSYYDDYSFPQAQAYSQADATAAAVVPAGVGVLPIAATQRTIGMSTGRRVRVLGTNQWLQSTVYYNEDGAVQQTIEQNVSGAADVMTMQYGWDGRTLATARKHGHNSSAFNGFLILTRYTFDKIGRATQYEQKYGSNPWRVMSASSYTDLGWVASKRLSPAYQGHFSGIGPAGGGLELLQYGYNLHGTLTSINRAYALKEGAYNRWSNFFGLVLAYANENPGNNFDQPGQLNINQLRGVLWNTQGDDAQRRYQYVYDEAGRFTSAFFASKSTTASAWEQTLNFSEQVLGPLHYNRNGDIRRLSRNAFIPGTGGSLIVDLLTYTYATTSSRLLRVAETSTGGSSNSGDFKDLNTTGDDYVYDANGNLVTDLNKQVKDLTGTGTAGIRYNHLDKPEEIRIVGKGTIKIQYDAGGAKLKREFVPENAGQGTRVVWYLGGYQYEEIVGGSQPRPLSLSFIGFADGRIRAYQPQGQVNTWGDEMVKQGSLAMPGGLTGAVDYFISDHRTDVRMILTEEQQYSVVNASMETDAGRANDEAGLFGAAVAAARVPRTTAAGWTANTSQHIMRLNGNGQRIGPSQLLKVMAGDLIHTSANYYHTATASNTAGSSIGSTVVSSLVGLLSGGGAASSLVKNNAAAIGTSLSGAPTVFTSLVSPDITSASGTLPKAYLCIAFFDERFTFVPEASQSIRVGAAHVNSMANPLALTNIKVPRNGYCFIYLINESGVDVFFDNLRVRHDRGRILEENHYYPFGLRIDGLSSRAYDGPANRYGYQGDYSEYDDDLGWNDFELRSYDPQLGRWLQVDPYDEFASGYVGMGNDPGSMVDPTGGFNIPANLSHNIAFAIADMNTVTVVGSLAKVGAKARALNTLNTPLAIGNKALNVVDNTGISKVPAPTKEQLFRISWDNQLVTGGDFYGNAITGPRKLVEDKIKNQRWEYNKQVGENIAGGVFGAAGYYIDGDDGSFAGAKLDQVVQAAGALQKPTYTTSTPRVENNTLVPQNKTVRKNGSTPANKRGIDLHKEYKKFDHDPSAGRYKEYTGLLKKYGIKPDFVDFNTRTIFDLKPNNPKKANEHLKQLENYRRIFEKEFGGQWNIVIDHY